VTVICEMTVTFLTKKLCHSERPKGVKNPRATRGRLFALIGLRVTYNILKRGTLVEWLQKTGPYLKSLINMLKYVSPFIGPWVGMADEAYKKLIDNDLKMMTELIKVMPDLIDDRELDLVRKSEAIGDHEDMERAHGAALRATRQLLDEVDPSQNWGGLRKVLTPEGHYLWLCEYHAKEYLI